MPARRYVIRGVVQGVGFRYFVYRHAKALGLTGWVRNKADGSVEVVALGDDEALAQLEKQLKRGPVMAVVDSVSKETVPEGEVPSSGFTIERDSWW